VILDEREVSLILLDLILPDTDGRDFLSRLRERLTTATVPVVIVTVKPAVQARAECFALGADDFLEKPVTAEALREVVEARLRLGPGIAGECDLDPLTGLPNRAAFTEQFKRTRAGISSSCEPATAAILAIDDFEAVVKQPGGKTAAAVMRHTAAVLARTFRSTDFLARSSGCEFAVLFPKTSPAGASIALGKALRALRESPVALSKGRVLELGFSAGLAPLAPGRILADVMDEAERHLHLAREAGGGRVVSAQDKVVPSRRKILIADDDELIRMVLQRLFEREGYETHLFCDGSAALQGAIGQQFSLIITDGSMPVMNGFDFVRRLRAHPNYSAVPVLMLTSMGSEADVVRGFELGADDYVLKPFSSVELLARVRRLIRRSPIRV
jgi:diguanylate cyclase (GGDEF)-like protein